MPTSTPVLVWAGLVLSMFASVIIGIDLAFNVYAVLLQETFNFTQTQVELTASMGTLGIGLSFLETIITERFGYCTTFILCWILMPLGAGSISLAALYKDIFAGLPVFIYAGQFMIYISNIAVHVAIVRINIERFPSHHSGKIFGMFWAMCSVGKIIYAILVNFVFSRDLAGFFLTLSVMSLVVYGACFTVLYLGFKSQHQLSSSIESEGSLQPTKNPFVTKSSAERGKQLAENQQGLCQNQEGRSFAARTPLLSSDNHKQVTSNFSQRTYDDKLNSQKNSENPPSLSEDRSVSTRVMLKSLSFHLTFWPSVLFYAIVLACMNNITSVSVSAGMDNIFNSVYVFSVCLVATRILFGLIFDKYPVILCGVAMLSVSYLCFAAAMLLGMFAINDRSVYMFTVLSGIGMGPGMTIPTSLIMKLFGKSNYGRVAGAFWGLLSLFLLIIQVLMGVFYDSQSNDQQVEHFICYGEKCFFWPFALTLLITAVVFISQWLNYVLTRKTKDAD